MKTIILTIICFIVTSTLSSNQSNERRVENLIADKGAVYEGIITEVYQFYGVSVYEGLTPTDWVNLTLDTYPDLSFKVSIKKGIKWGLFEELAPGLHVVGTCKGWYVKLTVNNDMEVTKCRIL